MRVSDHPLARVVTNSTQPHVAQRKPKSALENHEFYFCIILDPETGKVSMRCSPAIKSCKSVLMQDHLIPERFLQCVQLVHDERSKLRIGESPLIEKASRRQPTHRISKRTVQNGNSWAAKNERLIDNHEPTRRESQSDVEINPRYSDDHTIEDRPMVQFRADETEKWFQWMSDAFKAVQQVSCRVIAKEIIKTIHPRKQSTHPYNGRALRNLPEGGSEGTKPPYWPPDVRHKEPDHINKEDRTKLLVHLVMNTPHREMVTPSESCEENWITAEKLEACLDRNRKDVGLKWPIIAEIFRVRKELEQYKMECIDGSQIIQAPCFTDPSNPPPSNRSMPQDNQDGEERSRSWELVDEDISQRIDTAPLDTTTKSSFVQDYATDYTHNGTYQNAHYLDSSTQESQSRPTIDNISNASHPMSIDQDDFEYIKVENNNQTHVPCRADYETFGALQAPSRSPSMNWQNNQIALQPGVHYQCPYTDSFMTQHDTSPSGGQSHFSVGGYRQSNSSQDICDIGMQPREPYFAHGITRRHVSTDFNNNDLQKSFLSSHPAYAQAFSYSMHGPNNEEQIRRAYCHM